MGLECGTRSGQFGCGNEQNRVPWYLVNAKDGTELVLIPGGRFWMGSGEEDRDARNDEKPRHLHYVKPYYLGLTCVSVAQFRRFSEETGHDAGKDWQEDPPEHPVRYVNLHDAAAYCKWAGLRLPTEAEWELAARGYGALRYPWGNDWEAGRRACWSGQTGPGGATAPVTAHPEGVSPLGTFQQSGNLWEWCAEWFEDKAYERYARGDLSAPGGGMWRVLRGGWWSYVDSNDLRGADRDDSNPESRTAAAAFAPPGQLPFDFFTFLPFTPREAICAHQSAPHGRRQFQKV